MQEAVITDGLLRKSLSAVRSLGKKGIRITVGEKTNFSPSGFSKYSCSRMLYPDPVTYPDEFMSTLLQKLKLQKHPVLLPMDDAVLNIVINNRDSFLNVCLCVLPPKEAYDIAADKLKTMMLAKDTEIEFPATLSPKTEEELLDFSHVHGFPLIIKPRKSSGSRGIRKVENREELLSVFQEIAREYPEPFIQQYIPEGPRYDVCLLFDRNSHLKASFVQKEIRHFPRRMGPSTVQESVKYPELIERSLTLLKPLKWKGIIEIEYMIHPHTGIPILMEINPRFWNSLDLAVKCGIDFPGLLYDLTVGNDLKEATDYPAGIRSRWLFPGDLMHFLTNADRFSMNPSFFSGKRQNVIDDTFSLEDPLPGMVFLAACVRYAFSVKTWKMFLKR